MATPSVPSESVLPESDRNEGRKRELTALAPFPTRSPESVVEPVPPKLTASVVVPETTPVPFVTRREFWMLETVRLVVEAVPKYPVPDAVNAVDDAYGNTLA